MENVPSSEQQTGTTTSQQLHHLAHGLDFPTKKVESSREFGQERRNATSSSVCQSLAKDSKYFPLVS